MRASIVIPCYNQQEYVSQAIDSALAQTHGDTEVIVVNDGSTDESLRRIEAYGTKIVVANQGNAGLAAARNAGFSTATGEFFLPLDADDYIAPSYLERTLPLMSDPAVGVVATDTQYFGVGDTLVSFYNVTPDTEKRSNEIPVCSLIRRTAFEQVGGYKNIFVESGGKRVYGFEDWELWIGLLEREWKAAIVNEPLFYYRTKTVSMLASSNSVRKELTKKVQSLHPGLCGGIHG